MIAFVNFRFCCYVVRTTTLVTLADPDGVGMGVAPPPLSQWDSSRLKIWTDASSESQFTCKLSSNILQDFPNHFMSLKLIWDSGGAFVQISSLNEKPPPPPKKKKESLIIFYLLDFYANTSL